MFIWHFFSCFFPLVLFIHFILFFWGLLFRLMLILFRFYVRQPHFPVFSHLIVCSCFTFFCILPIMYQHWHSGDVSLHIAVIHTCVPQKISACLCVLLVATEPFYLFVFPLIGKYWLLFESREKNGFGALLALYSVGKHLFLLFFLHFVEKFRKKLIFT